MKSAPGIRRNAVQVLVLCAALGAHMGAHAFKLKPSASDTENRVRYLEANRIGSVFDVVARRVTDHFSNPVHEEITHRIYGCAESPATSCVDPLPLGRYAPGAVLFGVQWNDNPPFQVSGVSDCPSGITLRLPNFSACWIKLFKDAEKTAADEYFDGTTGHALIYRVHFGDMQFLHAMASWDGEYARDTKLKIMAWAELMYRVSIADIDAGTRLADTGIDEIKGTFSQNGWTVEGLLTLGQDPKLRKEVADVAFGSLLHMVQDSFALGHVERDDASVSVCAGFDGLRKAGDVREFHSYSRQNKSRHAEKDSRNLLEAHLMVAAPTVVDIGKALVDMRARKAPWTTVKTYFDQCVFPLQDGFVRHPAGPGAEFRN